MKTFKVLLAVILKLLNNSKLMLPTSIVSATIMAIVLFLPWYSGGMINDETKVVSSMNAFYSMTVKSNLTSFDAMKIRSEGLKIEYEESISYYGITMLLVSLLAIIFSFKKNKWTIFFGILNFILVLIWITSRPDSNVKLIGGIEVQVGVVWGAYTFLISSIVFIIANIRTIGIDFNKILLRLAVPADENNPQIPTPKIDDPEHIILHSKNISDETKTNTELSANHQAHSKKVKNRRKKIFIIALLVLIVIVGIVLISIVVSNQTSQEKTEDIEVMVPSGERGEENNNETLLKEEQFLQAENLRIADSISNAQAEIAQSDSIKLIQEDCLGTWTGAFGNNSISLILDNLVDVKNIEAYSILKGKERQCPGTVIVDNGKYYIELKEPGDDEWDGIFKFTIFNETASGSWKANNGKLTRDFILKRE